MSLIFNCNIYVPLNIMEDSLMALGAHPRNEMKLLFHVFHVMLFCHTLEKTQCSFCLHNPISWCWCYLQVVICTTFLFLAVSLIFTCYNVPLNIMEDSLMALGANPRNEMKLLFYVFHVMLFCHTLEKTHCSFCLHNPISWCWRYLSQACH